MSGYLQRLVTTAIQGKVGVHPIVRPWRIEAGVQERAWREFGAAAEPQPALDTASAEDMTPGEGTTVATAIFDGAASSDDRPPSSAGHVRDRTAAQPTPAAETMTPLFGPIPGADPLARAPAAGTGGLARPSAAHPSRPGPPADRPGEPTRERHTTGDVTRPGPWPVTARPGPPAPPAFRREPDRRSAASGSSNEADRGDVEIHIGRIEVTAVSPPPAAPVAKAERKSINLSEYLRNGR